MYTLLSKEIFINGRLEDNIFYLTVYILINSLSRETLYLNRF